MSAGVLERRWQLAIRLTVAGLVWSVGLVLAALLIGAYSGRTVSSARHHRRSAWSGPVAWAAVAVLAVEAILGIASFGAFLIPMVILLGLSVRLVPGPPAAPAPARSPGSPAIDS